MKSLYKRVHDHVEITLLLVSEY